jgi:hypothetical protein
LPGIISKRLQEETKLTKSRSDFLTQLIIPVSMQVFNTPLHLLGLDIYNRENATLSERSAFIKKEYTKTLIARMGHIFPAYGIGGVLNEHLRQKGKAHLQTQFRPASETDSCGEARKDSKLLPVISSSCEKQKS